MSDNSSASNPAEANSTPNLKSRPDIAQEVGFLFMYAANLDGWLAAILAEIIGDEQTAFAIVRHVDNLSAKLAIAFELAEQRPDNGRAVALIKHREAVTAAIAYRNTLAHSMFGWDPNNNLALIKGVNSTRRGNPRAEPVDKEVIATHSENLRLAIKETMPHVTSFVVGLPDPQAPASRDKQLLAIPKLERLRPARKAPQ